MLKYIQKSLWNNIHSLTLNSIINSHCRLSILRTRIKTAMILKNLHISIRLSLLLIYMRSSSTYSLLNASKSFMINEIRQKEISVSITKAQPAFSQVTTSRPMFKTMCALKTESSLLEAMQQSSERRVIRCDMIMFKTLHRSRSVRS